METGSSFYTSAPTSPRRLNVESLRFFSVPTSPTKGNLSTSTAFDLQTEPTTPSVCDDGSGFDGDEFEFETSRHFSVDDYDFESVPKCESRSDDPLQGHGGKGSSVPAMAFADELFSDGKVMPLKPPPRLQYPNDYKLDKQVSSTLSSPRSPTAVLMLPFRRNLWNDDFDPFMAAFKNVKEEKGQAKNHRRARSMSPFREIRQKGGNDQLPASCQQQINEMGLILPMQQAEPISNKRIDIDSNESHLRGGQEEAKQVKGRPNRFAEPKGVLFARRARLVKVGHEKPTKPSAIIPTSEAGDGEKEGGQTCAKESKRQRIKKFLFRSGSLRKISNEENKPKSMELPHYKEEKKVSEVARVTLIQYRPKLLLCIGYGGKYVE